MAANNLSNLSNLLNLDNDIGTCTKPPRLVSGDNFQDWKFKFQSFIKGLIPNDPELFTENDILLKEKDDKE
ncbi:hypothetical protein R6Q59_001467 [Mikania micrantha]